MPTIQGTDGDTTGIAISTSSTPRSWDEAILAAFRKVNDQIFAQMYPTFDFTDGSLALSRIDQMLSGAGSALTYSPTGTGQLLMIKGTTAAGYAGVMTPAGITFGTSIAPQAVATRVRLDSFATFDANTQLEAGFTDANTWGGGIGYRGSKSLTKFCLFLADGTGSNDIATTLDLPASAGDWIDIGVLFDGQRLIGFAGQAHLGTFVPDLVNVLTDLSHGGNPPFGSTRGRVILTHNANVAKNTTLDKFNIWQGMVP